MKPLKNTFGKKQSYLQRSLNIKEQIYILICYEIL